MKWKKIVVIGPESTGKSTLCKQLAEYYNTSWVPEYAREYLTCYGSTYNYDDLLTIAKGQVNLENSYMGHEGLILFVDTDLYVMKVWSEFVFDRCHSWILNMAAKQTYDLYLLCNVDLPWEEDELREYPDIKTRSILYKHYLDIVINQNVPWIDISGDYINRFQKAVDGINQLILS